MRVFVLVAAVVAVGAGLNNSDATSARAAEVGRVRSQLDSALKALALADVSALNVEQRARRLAAARALRSYQARGEFPHNYDYAEPMPYFVDRKTGARCAVAFLLESTGRRDIVDRLASTNNNVWVAELAGDTAVTTWLASNGLTLREAADIQEPYMPPQVWVAPARTNTKLAGITAGVSLGSSLFNAASEGGTGKWRYVLGAASGLSSVIVSARAMTDDRYGNDRTLHKINVVIGTTSVAIAVAKVAQKVRLAEHAAKANPVTVTPVANLSDRSGGVTVAFRF